MPAVHDGYGATVVYDLRLLPSFLAVAEERHFGRAADRLDLAQPALSQQIRRLETQLGVQLFVRDARRVELTGAGEAFLPAAREAVQAAQRAAVAAQRSATGAQVTLRVAADLDLPARIIARLRNFAQMRPDIELRLVRQHQGDALAALHADQVDAVVGWGRMPYGPPIRSLTVDAEEVLAVLRDDHPEAHRPTIARELFGRRQFVMVQREPSPDVYDWLSPRRAPASPSSCRSTRSSRSTTAPARCSEPPRAAAARPSCRARASIPTPTRSSAPAPSSRHSYTTSCSCGPQSPKAPRSTTSGPASHRDQAGDEQHEGEDDRAATMLVGRSAEAASSCSWTRDQRLPLPGSRDGCSRRRYATWLRGFPSLLMAACGHGLLRRSKRESGGWRSPRRSSHSQPAAAAISARSCSPALLLIAPGETPMTRLKARLNAASDR
jgi:DNA-binding transcriptional LysR family regulator